MTEPVALRQTILRSATKQVTIGHEHPFCIIGERINPTGRKIFQEALRAGDLSLIEKDVAAQVAGGADVLDVNMGVPLTDRDELEALALASDKVQRALDGAVVRKVIVVPDRLVNIVA